MAYQIDLTESVWIGRRRRKALLRLLLLGALGAAAWGAYDCYETYNQPTLNMRLANYEAAAYPIEDINVLWDGAAKEYGALFRYYRLLWAANPTNFLGRMVTPDAPRLGRQIRPLNWSLKTGGDCVLGYRFTFDPGDKFEQAKGLEDRFVHAVTSVVAVTDGKVEVAGVRHENLLDVDGFDVSVRFRLPEAKAFPDKGKKAPWLAERVKEIEKFRKKVQEDTKLEPDGDTKGSTTAGALMIAYLPRNYEKGKPDFPQMKNVINVAGWFSRADQFIARHRIPIADAERQKLKAVWNKVGEARFPWERFRVLDNEELVLRTTELKTIAEGVSRLKKFLEPRHAFCLRMLEPFVECYDRSRVFNEPVIRDDLVARLATAVGVPGVQVAFRDEPGGEPSVLEKTDEKFTFSWVRWSLTVGGGAKREGEQAESSEPLPLGKLSDYLGRMLGYGPGYALDSVKIDFAADGTDVAGAVVEGLLPVKKYEAVASTKGDAKNVH